MKEIADSLDSSSSNKEFVCTWVDPKSKKKCNKVFHQKGNLQQHMRMHRGERPHACGFGDCKRTFTSSSNRDDHRRRHFNEKPYACVKCGEKFFRRYQLVKHTEKNHNSKIEGESETNEIKKDTDSIEPILEEEMIIEKTHLPEKSEHFNLPQIASVVLEHHPISTPA